MEAEPVCWGGGRSISAIFPCARPPSLLDLGAQDAVVRYNGRLIIFDLGK